MKKKTTETHEVKTEIGNTVTITFESSLETLKNTVTEKHNSVVAFVYSQIIRIALAFGKTEAETVRAYNSLNPAFKLTAGALATYKADIKSGKNKQGKSASAKRTPYQIVKDCLVKYHKAITEMTNAEKAELKAFFN